MLNFERFYTCLTMNNRIIASFVLLCLSFLPLCAEDAGKVRLAYDVDFEMNFDNREFYRSAFSSSMTIFGARLTPSVGISLCQPEYGINHRLMAGIDVMKDFGASPVSVSLAGGESGETSMSLSNAALVRELTLYYNMKRISGDTGLELYAGIFPRKASEGRYSEVFFSDSLRFYDNNLEGLLVKVRRPKAYWEIGCDWFGQYGQVRKEKFMIFSSGESHITDFFSAGYAAICIILQDLARQGEWWIIFFSILMWTSAWDP